MIYAIQIIFVLYNISTAIYQAHLFALNKNIRHALWAAIYVALIVPVWFLYHNWALCAACLVLRLPVFNTALNLLRHKPFFYTGTASILDKAFTGFYPTVFFLSIAIWVALQFFI